MINFVLSGTLVPAKAVNIGTNIKIVADAFTFLQALLQTELRAAVEKTTNVPHTLHAAVEWPHIFIKTKNDI